MAKIRPILPLLLIGITGIVCYSNIFNSFFLSDDFVLLALYSKLGAFGLWVNQQHGKSLFFRPVLSVISFLDYQLWGLTPFGYHLTNFLCHTLNAIWVGLIAALLLPDQQDSSPLKRLVPYLAGSIFLLLPSHTEPVSWISARTDVISSFFAFGSFAIYLKSKQNSNSALHYLSLFLFLFGLLSKESIVSFPGIILAYEAYEYYFQSQPRKSILIRFWMVFQYGIVLVIYFGLRYWKLNTLVGGYGEQVHLQFNLQQIFMNCVIYPTRSLLAPHPTATVQFWLGMFLAMIGLSLLGFIISWVRRSIEILPLFIFLSIGFFLAVLPAITVMVSTIDTQGERYLYFASGFSAIFLAILINLIFIQPQLILIVSSLLLLYFGLSTHALNQNWKIAGEMSQNILQNIQTLQPAQPTLITSLPDNYRGAYIYRTGLIHGLYLFDQSNQFKIKFQQESTDKNFDQVQFTTNQIIVMMNHEVLDLTDTVSVNLISNNTYDCQLSNLEAYFLPWKKYPMQTDFYEIVDLQSNQYEFKLLNPSATGSILFDTAGMLNLIQF